MYLAKLLGLSEIATAAKWAVRLVVMGVLLILLIATVLALIFSESARQVALVIVVVSISAAVVYAFSVRRKPVTSVGERTIDGKVVPELLAVAALDIPEESPDADYVLRGLPDYGKQLLKLDAAEFAYIPEPIPERLPQPPSMAPAVNRPWLGSTRRTAALAFLASALVLLIGVGIYAFELKMQQEEEDARMAKIVNAPPSLAVAEKTSTLPPPPLEAAPPPTSIHAPSLEGLSQANPAPPALAAESRTKKDLFWTKHDNGPEAIKSWEEAESYCASLHLKDTYGWRLPTIEQLQQTQLSDFQLSLPIETLYSSTPDDTGHHWSLNVGQIPDGEDIHNYAHALCVHD